MGNSSLVRFMNERNGNGRGELFWHRAGQDGAPFRGHVAPMLREEEYEERVVRVGDPHVRIFRINTSSECAQDVKDYQEVLAKVVNGGWGQVIHVDRQPDPDHPGGWCVYIEWVQWYMEDGHPSAAQPQPELVGPNNGQQPHQAGNGPGNY